MHPKVVSRDIDRWFICDMKLDNLEKKLGEGKTEFKAKEPK